MFPHRIRKHTEGSLQSERLKFFLPSISHYVVSKNAKLMEKENARAHELEILKLLIPSSQTQVKGNVEAPSGSYIPQTWQPVGMPPTFVQYMPNGQQPINPIGANGPVSISVGQPSNPQATSNPQPTYSQQPGGLVKSILPEYFEL